MTSRFDHRFDLDSSRDEVISTNIQVWTGNWQGNSFSSVRGNPFAEIPAIYFNFVPWFSRNRIKFRLSWKLLSTLVQDSQWAQSLSKGLYLSLFALYYVNEIMETKYGNIYHRMRDFREPIRKGIPLSISCSHLDIRWNYFIATTVKVKLGFYSRPPKSALRSMKFLSLHRVFSYSIAMLRQTLGTRLTIDSRYHITTRKWFHPYLYITKEFSTYIYKNIFNVHIGYISKLMNNSRR